MKSTCLVLALATALAACAPGRRQGDVVMHPRGEGATMIPPPPPGASFARWEYLCLSSGKKEDLNVAGQRGWELVTVASDVYSTYQGFAESTLIYCFRRPLGESITPAIAAAVRDGGGTTDELIRHVAREFLDDVVTSPERFVGTARGVTHYNGRESTGVELYAIEPDSLFDKLGLRTGDVVTAIGEHEIDSVDDVVPAWKATREQSEVKVSYVRDGAVHLILVKLF
jgi:hypothetical protein